MASSASKKSEFANSSVDVIEEIIDEVNEPDDDRHGDLEENNFPFNKEYGENQTNGISETSDPEPIIPVGFEGDNVGEADSPAGVADVKRIFPKWLAIAFTLGWLGLAVFYLFGDMSVGDISAFLPHEVGIILTGLFSPVVLLWIFMSYYRRTRIYEKEAEALRGHLKQLTFPSDVATARATEVTNVLRAQSHDLTRASEDASERVRSAYNLIRTQTAALLTASQKANLNADSAGEKLRQQAEDLVNATDRAIARAREAGNVLHYQS
ncbi:MAG: hypothetical protein VX617_04640, partial [Pseudomonadota bacterium]|nr:hypothetical protein [Pseudomonadota bacterium]